MGKNTKTQKELLLEIETLQAQLKEAKDMLRAACSGTTEEIHLLQSLAIAVSTAGNLHDALVVAIQKICNYTGWIYGEAWIPNQGGTRLERDHAFYGSIDGLEKFSEYSCGHTFTPGSGLPGRAWVEKQPLWIRDVAHDPHYLRATIAGEVGFKTGVAFPVITDNEVVSVFVFYSLKEEERNDPLVKLILSTLSQIGSIIRHKNYEEKLEIYGTLFSEIKDLVYICDSKGNILFVNKIFGKLTGHKPEMFFGKSVTLLFDEENLKKAMDAFARTMAGESLQYELCFKDTGILCEYKSIPWRDKNGEVIGVMGVARDVTERNCTEQKLKESEERFRSIFDYANDGILIADAETKAFYTGNNMICQMLGYPLEKIKNLSVMDIHPKECLPDIIEKFDMLARGACKLVDDIPVRKYDGSIFYANISASPVTINGKKYLIGIFRDLTERKRMEDQLRKLSSAVEQSSTTIVITDTSGNIQYVNPKFTQLTGYTLKEAIGKNPRILKSGKTPPEVYKQLWDAITAGGDWQGEFCNKKKNGEFYWELAHISPLRNSKGAIINFIAFKDDITERKRMESEHEKLQEQLYRSQNLASVGELAGGIAHNFNNLLMVVMGYASLIHAKTNEGDSLKEYAGKILKSSQAAADLTRSLLAFSRKQPLCLKPTDLNDVIKESEFILSKLMREDVRLKTILTEKDCIVEADAAQIEQVLMNLATNAWDAMPNGGCLTISTEVVKIDDAFKKTHGYGDIGAYVRITVADTGMGMDDVTKARIFEPFFTTKEVGKGTGLGLPSVYGIVKQHGGYIDVDSAQGKGTAFNIYLPLVKSEVEEAKAEIPTATPKGAGTLLLAEDESEVRSLMRMACEWAGYKVIEAVDGEDALDKFTKNKDRIDLLIFDLIMPKKGGKEVYDEIKKTRPDMKVLFVTGYDDEVISRTDIHKEGLCYIFKPVSPSGLLKKVSDVLNK